MTCYFCDYEWCWLCGSTYTEDHFDGFNPMGCGGMMFTDKKHHWALMYLLKLGTFLLLLVLYPLILIFLLPCLITSFFFDKVFEVAVVNEPDCDCEDCDDMCNACCCIECDGLENSDNCGE